MITDDNYIIRRMKNVDIDFCFKIEAIASIYPWRKNAFLECLEQGYSCWVIVKNDKMEGFIIAQNVLDEVHILNIAVESSQQRTGLAGRLLGHIIELAKQKDNTRILLEVRKSNTPAIKLYEKYGFTVLSTRTAYYPCDEGEREDALVMVKILC